jgi:hypothetical protein
MRYSFSFPSRSRRRDPLHLAFNHRASSERGQRYSLKLNTSF